MRHARESRITHAEAFPPTSGNADHVSPMDNCPGNHGGVHQRAELFEPSWLEVESILGCDIDEIARSDNLKMPLHSRANWCTCSGAD